MRHSAGHSVGQSRLKLAAGLLKLDDGVDVLKHLNTLPPDRRKELQELVDWVQEYEACHSIFEHQNQV
jgi:hypothetical protein